MITPFATEHVWMIQPQPAQLATMAVMTPSLAETLVGQNSWTLWRDRRIVAIAGVAHAYAHCGEAWAILSDEAGKYMLAVDRLARAILQDAPYRRITTYVRCDFAEGHRWIKSLGFEVEAKTCRMAGPEMADYALYALVR
jgi:hypothetical protein